MEKHSDTHCGNDGNAALPTSRALSCSAMVASPFLQKSLAEDGKADTHNDRAQEPCTATSYSAILPISLYRT